MSIDAAMTAAHPRRARRAHRGCEEPFGDIVFLRSGEVCSRPAVAAAIGQVIRLDPSVGTPIIDRHTLQPAQPFPAMGAITDSAVSHPRRSGPDTPRGRETRSPAISQRVTPLGLAATAVLIFVVAVAAAFCAAHGWSHTVQQLVHALRHLPQPVPALVGGSAWAHLLN
jgi:hypothetical protein